MRGQETQGRPHHRNAAGERGKVMSKTFFGMLCTMLNSTLARVPRTCRDRRVVDQIVSEASMFATCGTIHTTKLSLAMKAWRRHFCLHRTCNCAKLHEDPLVRLHKWLRSDMVPPSPFLKVTLHLTQRWLTRRFRKLGFIISQRECCG